MQSGLAIHGAPRAKGRTTMSNRTLSFWLLSSCILGALASGCATPDTTDDGDGEVDSAAQAIGPAEVNPATTEQAKGWLRWAFAQP